MLQRLNRLAQLIFLGLTLPTPSPNML